RGDPSALACSPEEDLIGPDSRMVREEVDDGAHVARPIGEHAVAVCRRNLLERSRGLAETALVVAEDGDALRNRDVDSGFVGLARRSPGAWNEHHHRVSPGCAGHVERAGQRYRPIANENGS